MEEKQKIDEEIDKHCLQLEMAKALEGVDNNNNVEENYDISPEINRISLNKDIDYDDDLDMTHIDNYDDSRESNKILLIKGESESLEYSQLEVKFYTLPKFSY